VIHFLHRTAYVNNSWELPLRETGTKAIGSPVQVALGLHRTLAQAIIFAPASLLDWTTLATALHFSSVALPTLDGRTRTSSVQPSQRPVTGTVWNCRSKAAASAADAGRSDDAVSLRRRAL
jgi:hypothetical protein